jgi:hypothetical protein
VLCVFMNIVMVPVGRSVGIVRSWTNATELISYLLMVPVPTAWRDLRLRIEERPPAMEGRYVYIE